jgi:hypothetical protein
MPRLKNGLSGTGKQDRKQKKKGNKPIRDLGMENLYLIKS